MEFSKTQLVSTLTPAPQLGEHTEEVLLQIGYSHEEIDGLRRDKVI
jgi:crotonobetainyl-CoA:carnitine CoA-transferase CaiB-like acyl-CoA transferase